MLAKALRPAIEPNADLPALTIVRLKARKPIEVVFGLRWASESAAGKARREAAAAARSTRASAMAWYRAGAVGGYGVAKVDGPRSTPPGSQWLAGAAMLAREMAYSFAGIWPLPDDQPRVAGMADAAVLPGRAVLIVVGGGIVIEDVVLRRTADMTDAAWLEFLKLKFDEAFLSVGAQAKRLCAWDWPGFTRVDLLPLLTEIDSRDPITERAARLVLGRGAVVSPALPAKRLVAAVSIAALVVGAVITTPVVLKTFRLFQPKPVEVVAVEPPPPPKPVPVGGARWPAPGWVIDRCRSAWAPWLDIAVPGSATMAAGWQWQRATCQVIPRADFDDLEDGFEWSIEWQAQATTDGRIFPEVLARAIASVADATPPAARPRDVIGADRFVSWSPDGRSASIGARSRLPRATSSAAADDRLADLAPVVARRQRILQDGLRAAIPVGGGTSAAIPAAVLPGATPAAQGPAEQSMDFSIDNSPIGPEAWRARLLAVPGTAITDLTMDRRGQDVAWGIKGSVNDR